MKYVSLYGYLDKMNGVLACIHAKHFAISGNLISIDWVYDTNNSFLSSMIEDEIKDVTNLFTKVEVHTRIK